MIGSLLAYDGSGAVIATLAFIVAKDDGGEVIGLVDFEAHEASGGEHTAIWTVGTAVGSKVWPEWLGGRAHDFRVELDGPPGRKRIAALVHRASGHRRDRSEIERAIADRKASAGDAPADLRDLIGGPDRPIFLDDEGRTKTRPQLTRPDLPLVGLRGRD